MKRETTRPCPLSVLLLVLCIVPATAPGQSATPAASKAVREIDSPAPPGSAEPNLFADSRGRVFLSWIEPVGAGRYALRFSVREKDRWSQPRTIAEGANWFVNWADFPSLIALPDGELAAHWLVKSAADTYAYNVNVSLSTDGGKTWSKPVLPHRDGTPTEHGFVSLLPSGGGGVAAIWLDGRNFKASSQGHGEHLLTNEMTLRFTTMAVNGRLGDEMLLDGRVCECCQTSAATTSQGPVVVYRDRSEGEVRDVSVVRAVNRGWSEPRPLHDDGWKINGCPVNGPSVAADKRRVAAAWFTAARDTPRVNVTFSADAAATFGPPIQADDGSPVGRVQVLMLDEGAALVLWLERTGKGAEVRARKVSPDGRRGASIIVAESSSARSSGFPRMARAGNQVVFAWTAAGNPSRVRTAVMNLSDYK